MQYFSCGSDKYTEIKMCDLEPFSKIWSQLVIVNLRTFSIKYTIAVISNQSTNLYSNWTIAICCTVKRIGFHFILIIILESPCVFTTDQYGSKIGHDCCNNIHVM